MKALQNARIRIFQARSDQNKVVIFPRENFKKGDYVNVLITDATSATLRGKAVVEEEIIQLA